MSGNTTSEVRNVKKIDMEDAKALLDQYQAPSVEAIAPIVSGSLEVSAAGEKTTATIDGVTADYQSVRNAELTEGTFITDDNLLGRASVAIVGVDVADKLFDRRDGLVGESIRINGQPFRIIGVLASKGGSSFGSQDNIVLIPLTTAQIHLFSMSSNEIDMLMVQATSANTVKQASDEISQILRLRHRTKVGQDDFTIFSQEDFVATAQTITGVLTIFLGGIAAISLLVGGIGIMNIMLVSVTERTREIGLRKALGARKKDILIQFLTESSLLSLFGGVVGIMLGWLIAFVVGRIASASGTPFTPVVSLNAIVLATVFSTAVGLFFGLYPANRAASLEPVEALRYE
jgi:putative ABC transport system permease protein